MIKKISLLSLISLAIFAYLVVYAATSYRSDSNSTIIVNEQGTCKTVTNSGSSGKSYFIPTNTLNEWNLFRQNKPSDVSLGECYLVNNNDTQADWAANSQESQVDYTPTPPSAGDVILAQNQPVKSFENIDTYYVSPYANDSGMEFVAQGFKVDNTVAVNKIAVNAEGYSTLTLKIYSGMSEVGPTGLLATSNTINTPTPTAWVDLSINVILTGGTQYYFVFTRGVDPITFQSNGTNAYPDGTIWAYDPPGGTGLWYQDSFDDIVFRIYLPPYYTSGYIRTQTMDMGAVPTVNGEWILSDSRPAGTSISYQAWASATGVFAGEETDLGIIVNGTVITNLKRYYRVKATLNANTAQDATPILQSIKAYFSG